MKAQRGPNPAPLLFPAQPCVFRPDAELRSRYPGQSRESPGITPCHPSQRHRCAAQKASQRQPAVRHVLAIGPAITRSTRPGPGTARQRRPSAAFRSGTTPFRNHSRLIFRRMDPVIGLDRHRSRPTSAVPRESHPHLHVPRCEAGRPVAAELLLELASGTTAVGVQTRLSPSAQKDSRMAAPR